MQYTIVNVTKFLQNCSLVWCKKTKDTAIIDPGGDIKKIISIIQEKKLNIKKILITHGHIDHIGGAADLGLYYNVKIFGPQKKDMFWIENILIQKKMFGFSDMNTENNINNVWLEEGDHIKLGEKIFYVLHCPGHTPGHIVFFEPNARLLFSGDVIFHKSIGRTDFKESDQNILINSIKKKILPLGLDVTFIPGHGKISTIGYEKIYNPFLK